MEKTGGKDEVGEWQKATYKAGIERAYESADKVGKLDDERYLESKRLWGEYKAGRISAAELEQSLEIFNYKTVTLKEIKVTTELFDDRIIDEPDI